MVEAMERKVDCRKGEGAHPIQKGPSRILSTRRNGGGGATAAQQGLLEHNVKKSASFHHQRGQK